jgi:hypothetical protein
MIDETQVYGLTYRYTDEVRKVYISKLFEDPLNYIKKFTENPSDNTLPKYLIYSAHDTQIANIITHFAPGYNYTLIPYASVITFQFRKTKSCEGQSLESCLLLRIMYNGKFLDPSKDKTGFDVWKKHELNDTLEKPEITWEN